MNKTTIQLLVHPQAVERVLPVSVVEVSVAAKHLTRDVLAIAQKTFREAAGLASPVITCKGRERNVECGGSCGDWSVGARSIHAARGVGRSSNSGRVGRKEPRIMDLTNYPLLNETDVLTRWYLNRGLVVVKPGVGVTTRIDQIGIKSEACRAYRPADIVGQDLGLQTARPVLLSIS